MSGAGDAARREIVRHQLASVCDAMGATLMRAASSPNIKERLDFSCAAFDAAGRMLGQAAHIPVHLGALPAAVAAAAEAGPWRRGDAVLLNDPFAGGSHLPDLTIVTPVFPPRTAGPNAARPIAFLVSRAHHADIGGMTPGSLPNADDLFGEGLVLPPVRLVDRGRAARDVWRIVAANSRTPASRTLDLEAQVAAHRVGERRMADLVADPAAFEVRAADLLTWTEALARRQLSAGWPTGSATFEDALDDNGRGADPLPIRVRVDVSSAGLCVDFAGTAPETQGGLNAPLAVARAAAYYVACCGLPDVPINDGLLRLVDVRAPAGCLLNPRRPAAVAAGNVETSQRVVDVILGALAKLGLPAVPAASQGTMNNVLAGGTRPDGSPWAYYETMGGGGGAAEGRPGTSGLQVHMTNTRNTPIEVLESNYPVRVVTYARRPSSGGAGRWRGGDGVVRRLAFLAPAVLTVVSERRRIAPWGWAGGDAGAKGRNRAWVRGRPVSLGGKATVAVGAGDAVDIHSPGGGGWGRPGDG